MDMIAHAASVLKSFDIEPGPLDRVLDAYFRRHRELNSRERRLIAEAVFGVARWRRRLDGLLIARRIRKPNHAERAACYLLWKRPPEAKILDMDALSEEYGVGGEFDNAMSKGFPGGAAAFFSFPDFLYKMLVDAQGERESHELMQSLNEPSSVTLRVNSLLADRGEVLKGLADDGIEALPTALSLYGIRLAGRADISGSVMFRAGHVEIQDESSQLAAIVAEPKPGELILDACAGAGGKSLMFAMLMKGQGRVIASDVSDAKFNELRKRARRAKTSIIEAVEADKLQLRSDLKGKCDLVFIDAPCSGTGTLRRSPDLKWRLSEESIKERVEVQRGLISEYSKWVRPGGRLVYATCSVLKCENEDVANILRRDRAFEAIDAGVALKRHGISDSRVVSSEGHLKMDPRLGPWDGFFAAYFKNKGQA